MTRLLPGLLGLFVLACGPTAEALTTPTPPPAATPTTPGNSTSIPLSTPDASGQPGAVFRPLPDFPAEGAFEVTDVINTPQGFMAVGFEGLPGEGYFGRRQGVIWTSPDGLVWARVTEPVFEYVTPMRAAALGGDVFVFGLLSTCAQIFDDTCAETPDAGNVLWRSHDRGPWERLPVLPQMQLGLIDQVVVGQGQMIAFGSAGNDQQTSTAWLSSDGTNWSETSDLGGLDPISTLAGGPGAYVGFGTRYDEAIEDIQLTAAWSSDGLHFAGAQVPVLNGTAMNDVAYDQGKYVAVGYGASDTLSLTSVALYSIDAQSWTQASAGDASFGNSGLAAVHALSAGFVALGFTPHDEDFTVQDGRSWISADGQTWRDLALLGGSYTQFGASAVGPSGLVVFTAQQEELDDETVQSTIDAWFAPAGALIP